MIVTVEIKDSGIEWVKDIPSHWNILPLFAMFYDKQIKNSEGIENNVLSLSYGKIIRRNVEDNFGLLPESFNTYQIVDDDDIIMRLTDLQNDKRSLRVGLVREKGIITSAYLCLSLLRNQKANNVEYFYYLLHTYDKYKIFYNLGGGVRQSMGFADLKRMPLIVPPKDEQDEIVQYIKAQEEKINLFIQKKQRFIELLKEQKSTIVKSKFLNTNENWKRRKISHSFKIIGSGTTPESGNSDYYDAGEINWINTGDLNDGYLDKCEKRITQLAFDKYSTLKIYPRGTLLIALYGATIGKVSIMNIEGCTNQACCALFGSETFYTEFLFHWFIANRDMLIQMSYGGGQPNISQEIIRQLRISCPTIEEQKQIVSHIKTETATIDTAIAKAEREIELIREYKEAMIAEAVMGKRNVNFAH